MRAEEEAANIYSLIEELTDAVVKYLDGHFPDEYKLMGQDDDDALFSNVYEPLMDMEGLVRYVSNNGENYEYTPFSLEDCKT